METISFLVHFSRAKRGKCVTKIFETEKYDCFKNMSNELSAEKGSRELPTIGKNFILSSFLWKLEGKMCFGNFGIHFGKYSV